MPNINDSVTYTGTVGGSPTAPITYTWGITPGTAGTNYNVTAGSLGSAISLSQITVQWLTVGNFVVNCTSANGCSTVADNDGLAVAVTNGGGCTAITSLTIS